MIDRNDLCLITLLEALSKPENSAGCLYTSLHFGVVIFHFARKEAAL